MNNNTPNYGSQIVENLEQKGESPSYIIGFLTATLNSMHYMIDSKELQQYLARTVKQTQA